MIKLTDLLTEIFGTAAFIAAANANRPQFDYHDYDKQKERRTNARHTPLPPRSGDYKDGGHTIKQGKRAKSVWQTSSGKWAGKNKNKNVKYFTNKTDAVNFSNG